MNISSLEGWSELSFAADSGIFISVPVNLVLQVNLKSFRDDNGNSALGNGVFNKAIIVEGTEQISRFDFTRIGGYSFNFYIRDFDKV